MFWCCVESCSPWKQTRPAYLSLQPGVLYCRAETRVTCSNWNSLLAAMLLTHTASLLPVHFKSERIQQRIVMPDDVIYKREFKKFFSSHLWTLEPSICLQLLKRPSFPSRINNINLISACEIPHLAEYHSTKSNSWRHFSRRSCSPVHPTASACPMFLNIPHKKHEALPCLTSAPAWRKDACLICWGVGGNISLRQTKQ